MRIEIQNDFRPSKIVCVGRNYAAHARELGNEVPGEPLLFLKAPSSLVLPGSIQNSKGKIQNEEPDGEPGSTIDDQRSIIIPPESERVEHEGELAVIIGKICKNLSDSQPVGEYVLGYTCLNDVTARDLQRRDVQFTRAKSFDTFCPIGPWIETELDVTDLRVMTRVNGELRQDGRTSAMVFPVEFLIRYISRMMTLLPGDVIATGTPEGVGPLVAGDVCEVETEGIGVLKNEVKIKN